MIRSIVVPLDGSSLAEKAVDSVPHVLPKNGSITLLSIVRVPTTYFATEVPVVYTAADITKALKEEMDAAKQYLEKVAYKLRLNGYHVTCVVETGDPATAIADQARYYDAVVMTTHGRTGFGRLLYGSVTQQVIGMSPRPVIVIPNTQKEEAPETVENTADNRQPA